MEVTVVNTKDEENLLNLNRLKKKLNQKKKKIQPN